MDGHSDMASLAQKLRAKVFGEVPEDISVVVSADAINKAYLSGYVSMAHDLAPAYRSAAFATRHEVSLVASAADAGPAVAFLGDPACVERYGTFFFGRDAHMATAFGKDAHATFEDAFVKGLRNVAVQGMLVGIDRSNDDLAWNLSRAALGDHLVVDVTTAIARARMTKLPGEVDRLRRASRAVENGFEWLRRNGRAGMSEIKLAAGVIERIAAAGGIPRFVSVTSGPRSALADAYPTDRPIAQGEMIRVDAGCTVDGYWSDIARSFVFGEPEPLLRRTYDALQMGLEHEIAAVREGIKANELFNVATAAVRSAGIHDYRRQHCGHGIGLRSYDSPVLGPGDETLLIAGMCLCVETPHYELGAYGMMVEDMIQVTTSGHEPITVLPRDLIVIG